MSLEQLILFVERTLKDFDEYKYYFEENTIPNIVIEENLSYDKNRDDLIYIEEPFSLIYDYETLTAYINPNSKTLIFDLVAALSSHYYFLYSLSRDYFFIQPEKYREFIYYMYHYFLDNADLEELDKIIESNKNLKGLKELTIENIINPEKEFNNQFDLKLYKKAEEVLYCCYFTAKYLYGFPLKDEDISLFLEDVVNNYYGIQIEGVRVKDLNVIYENLMKYFGNYRKYTYADLPLFLIKSDKTQIVFEPNYAIFSFEKNEFDERLKYGDAFLLDFYFNGNVVPFYKDVFPKSGFIVKDKNLIVQYNETNLNYLLTLIRYIDIKNLGNLEALISEKVFNAIYLMYNVYNKYSEMLKNDDFFTFLERINLFRK